MSLNLDFDWKTYSWLKRGHRRLKVLLYLYHTGMPVTATQVKKAQKVDITQTAFTLTELRKKGLIKCLNPKDHHGKLFVISQKGKILLNKFKSLN